MMDRFGTRARDTMLYLYQQGQACVALRWERVCRYSNPAL